MSANAAAAVAFDYEDGRTFHSHDYLAPALTRFIESLSPGSRLVDLGCGNGSMLRKVLRPDLTACGVDASPSGIEAALALVPEASFYVGDVAGALPDAIAPGSFDAVISTETIEHVMTPRTLARNAFDLLKPGGAFFVSTPYHGYLKNLVLSLTNNMDAHFTALWDGGHVKFWSRKTLGALLTEAGFRDLAFQGAGRVPLLWKSMVMIAKKPE